jgi:hypothetical protein
MTNGSSLWQIIFVSFALVLILFEIVRGWRLGIVRQSVRLLALLAAYASALFGGRLLVPVVRPFVRVPDLFISILGGTILALVGYVVINALGAIFFKRTSEQSIGMIRLLYGICGAALGMFFGLFSVWLAVVAIRSLGAVAGAELYSGKVTRSGSAPASLVARARPSPTSAPPMVASLAKLKNSIELGLLGEAFKVADVVPTQTYETLGKVGAVVSNPRSAERLLSYPGAKELKENPRIVALRDDPEIIELIQEQRYLELLQNAKLIEAMNDPTLAMQVKNFDFQKALDYAQKK